MNPSSRSEREPASSGYDELPREVERQVAIIAGDEVRIARLVVGVTIRAVRSDNLRTGLAQLRKEPADIVLVAQDASRKYAQAVLRLLRGHEATAAIPVVVAAHAPDPAERTEVRTLGARRYLPSTVRPEHLLGLLDELGNRAGANTLDEALAPYAAPAADGRADAGDDLGSDVLPMSIEAILRTPFDPAQIPRVAMAEPDQLVSDVVLMRARVAASDRRAIEAQQEADELRRLVSVARSDIARLEVTVDSLNDALTRTRADLDVAEDLAGLR